MDNRQIGNIRYGMAIDVDRCTGCGACTVACAVENNIFATPPEAGDRRGLTWIRVYRVDNDRPYPDSDTVFVPLSCQQCGHHAPCVSVCPQNAIDVDPETGIVSTIPARCLGCRYCIVACPYHARYYNWWDPIWPKDMEKALNPDVSPRMRGVVEKCNFCHGRWQAARAKAAAQGRRELLPGEYVPACVEACPVSAIHFGNLLDENSELARLARSERSFRLLERLGTQPKVYYLSDRRWVRELSERLPAAGEEVGIHG